MTSSAVLNFRDLFQRDQASYAVLDGAGVPDLLDRLIDHGHQYVCLYRGELEPDIAEVAPYLVHLQPGKGVPEWLMEGWGANWGIFLHSPLEIEDVRKHLRRFLIVHDPDGKPLYFRYYDPRVLRIFLPTCNTEDLQSLFGPISTFWMEDEDPGRCISFSLKDGILVREDYQVMAKEED